MKANMPRKLSVLNEWIERTLFYVFGQGNFTFIREKSVTEF